MPTPTKKPGPRKAGATSSVAVKRVVVPDVKTVKPAASVKPMTAAAKPPVKVAPKPVAKVASKPIAKPVAPPAAKPVDPIPAAVLAAPITVKAAEIAPIKPASVKPVSLPTVLKPNFPQPKRSIMAPATFKGFEDFTSFGKESYDAMLKANALFTKGFEDIGKELMAMTQAGIETASSHTKAIMSAKSLKEVVDLNTEFTKSSIEKMVATSTKFSELGMKVTTEAMAPISARLTA